MPLKCTLSTERPGIRSGARRGQGRPSMVHDKTTQQSGTPRDAYAFKTGKLLLMERASTRKKQREINSSLLSKIALMGQSKFADLMGVHESQISRWKETLIPKVSLMLAVLEWGVNDDELAHLAKQVALLLIKKSPVCKTEDSQVTMDF